MQDKKKFLLSILIILCVLISLSAVAAQDSSDADIQESSSDISDPAISGVCDDQDELGKMADSPSATLGYSHQYNNSDESLESSSDSDKLGDGDISVYVPTSEPDTPEIYVTINDPGDIVVEVYTGDPPNTYTVSGNTFEDIQNTINRASKYDKVVIPAGTYVGNGTPIVISNHITLKGEGNPTLDAQSLSQILIVTDGYGHVTVDGITFINGNAPGSEEYGGAIVWGGSNGNIKNCNFINNHAGKYGGAIACKHHTCTVENCNFYYNTAKEIGAVIAANYNFKIKNCNFTGNSATDGSIGAAYLGGDNSIIENSYFANNTGELGGAVVIEASNGKILSTTFENNIAESSGGAVVLFSEGASIEGCHFNSNSAKYAAAIQASRNNIKISGCDFTGNRASKNGGAIYANKNNIDISDCDFTANRASEFGGAIILLGDNNRLSDSSFTNNRVEVHGGGAVYMDGTNLTVINSNFENNHARYAGALRLSGNDGKLLDSTFINNSASGSCGAVYHYSRNGAIENSSFVNNSAYAAGAVQLAGNNTIVRDSNFTNNQAIQYGGAIFAMNIDGTVDNCNFIRNTATAQTSYGGAILWGRDNMESDIYLNITIVNSYFSNNHAIKGHIFIANVMGYPQNYTCLIDNCRFNDDYTTEISVSSNSDLSLKFTIKAHYNYRDNSIWIADFSCIETVYCYADGRYDSWGYPPSFFLPIKSQPDLTVEIYNNTNDKLISNASVQADSWGSATYSYASLPNGEYRYRVYNLGDDGVLPGLSEGSFEIHRTPTNLSITVSNANYPETPMANVTASSPGTYTIVIAGETFTVSFSQDEIDNSGGQASKMVNLGILDASNDYVATVSYEMNNQYLAASTQTSFNVYQGVPEIDIAGTESYYGQDAVLNYAITDGIVVGSVVIKRGSQTLVEGTNYTVTISGGKIIISGLAEGNYTVNVATAENTNYNSNSDGATLIVKPLVDLGIGVSVSNQTPYYGDTVAYTITVSNSGPSAATDVIVSFTVPNGMNVSSPDASYMGNGVWNISRIAAGSENAVTLYATANSKETLTATVSVTSREDESNGEDNSMDISINPVEISDIHVSGNIAFDGNTLKVGDELTCTITVANRGPCDALNVSIIDEFDSNLLKLIGATLDGTIINYDEGYTIDSIANGSSCIIVLTFKVISNGTIENTLKAESDMVDPNESNNEAQCDSVIAIPLVDLIINASVDNSTPHYADTVTYTITVSNNGPSAATDITVTAAIPSGMNAHSTDASYTGNGIWKISSLGAGSENAITLSLNATVESLEALTTEFTVTSRENDSNAENNKASANLKAIPVIDLKISGVSNLTSFENIGDLIAFTMTVVNDGPCNASGVNVHVALSEFVKFISADGSFDNTSNIWEIGNLSSKDSCSLVLTLEVIEYNDIINSVSVNADEIDLNESNNNLSISVTAKKFPTVIVANNMVTTAIDAAVDGNKGQYFTVTLKDSNNNPLAGQTVKITLNNVVYTVQTKSDGIASVQVNIKKAGTYKATISFAGSKKYLGSSASASIKVNKQKPKLTSSKKTFKAKAKTKKLTTTLKTSRGKVLKGKKVIFTIKGKKYIVKTNKKGVATAKIKLTKKGKRVCKIKFAGDSTYSAITKSIKVVIK